MKPLLDEKAIAAVVERIPRSTFTVLEFMDYLEDFHPQVWNSLLERYGTFGQGRRYTGPTYLSNRLVTYSQKEESLLHPFRGWQRGRVPPSPDYRRSTDEEKKRFGSPWIAIFRKRELGRSRGGTRRECQRLCCF